MTKDERGKEAPGLASSGGGERFLDFVEKELIPQVEGKYRTMPYRMLVGHSFGGLLAMDALLRRPSIFQGFIAIDPTLQWDQQIIMRRATEILAKTNDFRGQVFISIANNPPMKEFDPRLGKQACLDFADLLERNNTAAFRSSVRYFEGENHGSVPLPSLYYGLLFVFDGYKPPGAMLFEEPASLGPHFAKFSERIGMKFLPSEAMLTYFGNDALYGEHDPRKALEYFKLNAANYPESFSVWDRLAWANDLAGNQQLAASNYCQLLKLTGSQMIDRKEQPSTKAETTRTRSSFRRSDPTQHRFICRAGKNRRTILAKYDRENRAGSPVTAQFESGWVVSLMKVPNSHRAIEALCQTTCSPADTALICQRGQGQLADSSHPPPRCRQILNPSLFTVRRIKCQRLQAEPPGPVGSEKLMRQIHPGSPPRKP